MFGDADPGTGTVTGSFDQFGILCSRCHGSRPYSATSSYRHHPTAHGFRCSRSRRCAWSVIARRRAARRTTAASHRARCSRSAPAHSSVDFVSHAGANEFLNSPHGRFSGTFAQINDPTFYDTHFKNEGEPYPFQGNQGGCVQCHDVHKSTLPRSQSGRRRDP